LRLCDENEIITIQEQATQSIELAPLTFRWLHYMFTGFVQA